jgi:thioredoxin reductase (NADPH)
MIYDIAIIGAGPAGLNAAVYAARYGLKTVVIGALVGGTASTPHEVGNWLGTEKISGFELAQNMLKHAKSYGTPVIERMADEIVKTDTGFKVTVSGGEEIQAKTLLLATGTTHRHLGVPGESKFIGKGLSYCATCDGFFFKDKTVAVVGGNDAAATAAVFLGDIAEKVYMVYRKEPLKAEKYWQDAIAKNAKIEVIYNTVVTEIIGTDKVEGIKTENIAGEQAEIKVDGVFVEIGSEPNSEVLKDLGVESDEKGFVKIQPDGSTTAAGIWAAGDLTNGSNGFRQIITAASEGAIAAASISKYLKTL